MDSVFFLEEGDRTAFLIHMMESCGCTYVCLWQYFQPSNCLTSLDGIYQGENEVARRLFEEYRHSWLIMYNGRVPGLALKSNHPYIELQLADLQSFASIPVQLQFYQEAGIKRAIFMGCSSGEIELGMSSSPHQVNRETLMMNLFPKDFTRKAAATTVANIRLPQPIMPTDQNRPSSSSSSLRSLVSADSPEYSSLVFNVATTSYVSVPPVSATAIPYQQANIQAITRIGDLIPFPSTEHEDAAITRAYLAVISSHSPSREILIQKYSAFRRYFGGPNVPLTARTRGQNMLERSIIFYRNLNLMRRQEQIQANRPTSTQVHHMISERRRREKLNESYQQLRALLPPGTKKDKASVLASTIEYLISLKSQVEELSKKNEMLEAQAILTQTNPTEPELLEAASARSLVVQLTNVAESTSEARIVDLQVSLRGESSILDLVMRLLEFLNTLNNVSLESVDASSRIVQADPINYLTLRLKIQDGEWDETAFQEAVRRVVRESA